MPIYSNLLLRPLSKPSGGCGIGCRLSKGKITYARIGASIGVSTGTQKCIDSYRVAMNPVALLLLWNGDFIIGVSFKVQDVNIQGHHFAWGVASESMKNALCCGRGAVRISS